MAFIIALGGGTLEQKRPALEVLVEDLVVLAWVLWPFAVIGAVWLLLRLADYVGDALNAAIERRHAARQDVSSPEPRRAPVRTTRGIWRGRPAGGGHIPDG